MITKLFVALYVGLLISMFILFFVNAPVAWIFFIYLFVAVFGGMFLIARGYLIVIGFLLSSIIVLGAGLFGIYQSRQVGTWPTAAGEITRSWFCTKSVNGSVVYSGPCIEYRYSVNGRTFDVSSTDTGEFAQQWWFSIPDTYKQGREVKVYYDRNNPGISRLMSDIPARDWLTLLIGGFMVALSAFTLLQIALHRGDSPPPVTPSEIRPGQALRSLYRASLAREPKEPVMPNIADQLGKLAELHEKRAITDEEYEQAKKQLLGTP